ncbi:MAG: hypothetical protein RR711_12510, partial [Bacteroides sp.]
MNYGRDNSLQIVDLSVKEFERKLTTNTGIFEVFAAYKYTHIKHMSADAIANLNIRIEMWNTQ